MSTALGIVNGIQQTFEKWLLLLALLLTNFKQPWDSDNRHQLHIKQIISNALLRMGSV